MAKKVLKEKSPIKLRKKRLSNGNYSLYLDLYIDGIRKKEYLKLYLIPEKTQKARELNIKTLEIAETIRAERVINMQASKSESYKTDNSKANITFVDYMEFYVDKIKCLKSRDYVRRYRTGISWVRRFDAKISLSNINKSWVESFIKFLSITPGIHGRLLNQNTIHEYLIYIANVLNNAVREGVIKENPTKKISPSDRPKKYESKKEYLTQEELKKLIEVPSPDRYNDIRSAFLFSCFCGLRYSDIKQLKWENIKTLEEKTIIEKSLQKTKNILYLPLNKRALEVLPPRKKDKDCVFNLPKSMSTVEIYVRIWAEFAQIQKHVTFHTARHTFAVTILSCGGDIYTLSKLLGHKRVTTTQIYADILDDAKKKTMDLIDTLNF